MPNEPTSKKGSRACKPKVRTGCVTCNTGRKCDGYAPISEIKRRIKSPEARQPDCVAFVKQTSSPAFEIFDDDFERRSFAFFKARTARELGGYFPSDFWERLVPLATYYEPSLKHAAIALASLHERFERRDRNILKSNIDIVEGGFALQQYNKAIQHLVKGSRKPSLDTSLVACALFACFESLRGHHGSALSHIRSGTRILSQMNEEEDGTVSANESKQLCIELETLDVVFARLDAQEVQLLGSPPMRLPRARKNAHPGFCSEIPSEFKSLEEARNNLNYQWNVYTRGAPDLEIITLLRMGKETPEQRTMYDRGRKRCKATFLQWSNTFQRFLENNVANMESRALQGAMVLKMNALTVALDLNLDPFSLLHDQTCWDQLLPMYEELVDLATAVIDAQRAQDQEFGQKPIFQVDQSTVGPLFTVARRCRDPFLRRRAIALLYSAPRQEGVWDSTLTARVAERIMHMEEDGLGEVKCCSDVPDQVRISDIKVFFDLQARRGYVNFSPRWSLGTQVREPVTDMVEW
ncbi:MAG: hypothetical protein Q9201_003935 [Fulgogasparrea decipioides]